MREDIETKSAFKDMMTAVWSIYSKELSKDVLKLYWNALKRFELEDVSNAFSLHVQNPDNGQFVPKPADLIRALTGTNANQAMSAWSKVEAAIRSVGPWRTVVFDDPIIHSVIADMGGWIALNNITNDELPFRANEFEKRYQGYSMRGDAGDYPRKLIGTEEAHNAINGDEFESPMLIGDKEKSEQVFLSGSTEPKMLFRQMDKNLSLEKLQSLTQQVE